MLNLRAAWDFSPRWTAILRVNNALDRTYADRADFAFGDYLYLPGRPRSVFAGDLAFGVRVVRPRSLDPKTPAI